MVCVIRTLAGELRVTADYAAIRAQLAEGDDGWIEVQEDNEVQTRHLIRRTAVVHVAELLEAPRQQVSAKILG